MGSGCCVSSWGAVFCMRKDRLVDGGKIGVTKHVPDYVPTIQWVQIVLVLVGVGFLLHSNMGIQRGLR